MMYEVGHVVLCIRVAIGRTVPEYRVLHILYLYSTYEIVILLKTYVE